MKPLIALVLLISGIRLSPHVAIMLLSANRHIIARDLDRWGSVMFSTVPAGTAERIRLFVRLMTFKPEYRNLFYYRVGLVRFALQWLCRPMSTLYIHTKSIGAGLFIQHGFATIIAAAKIGDNCWINQQVTLGFTNATDSPTLGNNVVISAGAKVLGKVFVESNSTVGANAVVVKNVPPNATVVGVPAYIVRREGRKVHEQL